MSDVKIDVEVSAWFEEDGVLSSMWIGEACEPAFEEKVSYRELVEKSMDSYTVRGKIHPHHESDVDQLIDALQDAADYARVLKELWKDDGNEE